MKIGEKFGKREEVSKTLLGMTNTDESINAVNAKFGFQTVLAQKYQYFYLTFVLFNSGAGMVARFGSKVGRKGSAKTEVQPLRRGNDHKN